MEEGRQRLWPIASLFGALALAATTSAGNGSYIADNRFEQYYNPARSLAKMFSVWDGSRGLGAPREDVWLGTTIPVALLRGIGFSPALSEHVWHALCLVTLGLGVVVLMRLFRPTIGLEHVLAGILVMFGPYSASFLLPSNLYVMFALSPWLLVAFIRGVCENRPWRWAAVFALIVLWAGNSDVPGLLYVTIEIVVVALYLVIVERSARWRDVIWWLVKAGALAASCSAWVLAKTFYASDPLDARLADTELPSASAKASSWSESIRGLGNWLSYFREDGRLLKPQTVQYFEQPLVVAATFVIPVLALVTLWRSTWRPRLFFGALMIGAVVVMVGGFGTPRASPAGEAILSLLEHVNVLTAFRNTYKAGGGVVIGSAVLAATGAASIWRWCSGRTRRRAPWRIAAGVAGSVVLVGFSLPFASGSTYHPDERTDSIPSYWTEAFKYLDSMPAGGRSLIVPAISQTKYRWGYVGDDIFDALLARPHAAATGWMLSTRTGHNALETITLWAQSPTYRRGVLGPLAHRLGVTEIVLRNDVDWQRANIARPASFDGLRTDPDFERVAGFGESGSNVVSGFDNSIEADRERLLQPVEIFRLRPQTDLVDVNAADPEDSVIVAGDAQAWPQLSLAGLTGPDTKVIASAAMGESELLDSLHAGASVVMTDTARRRVRTLLRHEPQLSPTLAAGEEQDRPVRPVYPSVSGSESVASFADARSIVGAYIRLGGNHNDRRAALAFDDDPTTSWAVPWSGLGPTPSIDVDLRRPIPIAHATIQSMMTSTGTATVAEVNIAFSDGTSITVPLDKRGHADVRFPSRLATGFTIEVTDINVFGFEVGLSDVTIGDLDLVEHITNPVDLADHGSAVLDALRQAPTAYTFGRVARTVSAVRQDRTTSVVDEERTIRRRFDVVRPDELRVSGDLLLLASTSDVLLNRLLDGRVSATSDRSTSTSADGPAALVLDRDTDTSWVGDAVVGDTLTVHVPNQRVELVRIVEPVDPLTARILSVDVDVGGHVARVGFRPTVCARNKASRCTRTATVSVPPGTSTDTVVVRIAAIDKGTLFASRVRIAEVAVIGTEENWYDIDTPVSSDCLDLGLRIGSEQAGLQRLKVRTTGKIGEVLDRRVVGFEACDTYSAVVGGQMLDTGAESLFDRVALVPVAGMGALGRTSGKNDPRFTYRQESPDLISATVNGSGTFEVTLRTSFDPRWTLEVNGRSIPSQMADGGNSWTISADGLTTFTLRYGPSVQLRRALGVSIFATGLCVLLALAPFRRRSWGSAAGTWLTASDQTDASEPDESDESNAQDSTAGVRSDRRRDAAIVVAASLFGVVLVGPWTIAIAIVTLAMLRWLPAARTSLGLAPPVLLGIAAAWSLIAEPGAIVDINYATQRPAASGFAALAVVFVCQVVGVAAADERRASARPRTLHDRPSRVSQWREVAASGRKMWTFERVVVIVAATVAMGGIAATADLGSIPAGLISNLRLGTAYSEMAGTGGVATRVSPLPAFLLAWAPVSERLLASLAGVSAVLGSAALARRWALRYVPSQTGCTVAAGPVAAITMALLAVMWINDLPALVALSAATAAVLVAESRRPGWRIAFASGLLAAAAILCQPAAIFVLVIIGIIWRRSAVTFATRIGTALIVAVLIAPWIRFGLSERSFPSIIGANDSITWIAGLICAALAIVVTWRRSPDALTIDRAP